MTRQDKNIFIINNLHTYRDCHDYHWLVCWKAGDFVRQAGCRFGKAEFVVVCWAVGQHVPVVVWFCLCHAFGVDCTSRTEDGLNRPPFPTFPFTGTVPHSNAGLPAFRLVCAGRSGLVGHKPAGCGRGDRPGWAIVRGGRVLENCDDVVSCLSDGGGQPRCPLAARNRAGSECAGGAA